MFVFKLLFCVSVLSSSQMIFARTGRSCFDCISIDSCGSGLDFARKLHSGALPPESRQTFFNAMCGFDESDNRTPKVCCSDFDFVHENHLGATNPTVPPIADPIENHRNIGLLPSFCGDIEGSRKREVALLYEFPWMTLISYNTRNGWQFNCAGSVINSRYILTAAHCVIANGTFKDITGVRVGDHDYATNLDCQGDYDNMICESKIQDLGVEEIIPHPRFTGRIRDGADIALLRVKKPITMTNNVAPVCLPVYSNLRNLELAGKNGTVAGWGTTEYGEPSTKLRKFSIPILTGDACGHYYTKNPNQLTSLTSITEMVFCAGTTTKYSCNSDSGGPLMMESEYNESIRLVQFGIVSFRKRNCFAGYPGVYTDVTKYVEWILDNLRE